MAHKSLETLIKRVRARAKEIEPDLKDVAEKAGIDRSQLSRYLNAVNEPPISALDRLARALRVTPAWLIADAAETEHPIEECLRRVGAAAIRGAYAPGKGAADTAAHLKREPDVAELIWVLEWIQTHPRGAEFVEQLAADFRAKAQSKAKRESRDP